MMSNMTLGSLFDGAGGFPLAGTMAGITPVWNSEIEPFPIRVTTKRFPNVKHYGDVSVLSGEELEPVDIITFGSPCQDLSIAGMRAGLKGSRSGLLYQAIRIVKEMREATNGVYPRYIVWENVAGALSCNRGEDFRTVLEQVCSVKDREVSIPRPAKWLSAGEILGDGYSVAWRVVDAQYWGVPQMRRRVYLVADFGGESAGEIQFKQDRLYRDSKKNTRSGKDTSRTADGSSEMAGRVCLNTSGGKFTNVTTNVSGTLLAESHGHLPVVSSSVGLMTAGDRTLNCRHTVQAVMQPYSIGDQQLNSTYLTEKARTLNCRHTVLRYLTPLECCRLQGFPDYWCADLDTPEPTEEELDFWCEVFETHRKVTKPNTRGRSRAQIRKWLQHPQTDNAEHKMWGNSLAIPNAYHVLAGIAEQEKSI